LRPKSAALKKERLGRKGVGYPHPEKMALQEIPGVKEETH